MSIAFIALLFGLFSCVKEEQKTNSSSSQTELENNQSTVLPCTEYPMLNFETVESFRETVNQLSTLSESQYSSIPILSNFLSERTFINSLNNKSEPEICILTDNGRLGSEDVELTDNILSSLVNPNHEIKIAGVIFEINNDFVYGYLSCQDKNALNFLKLNKNLINTEKGKFTKNLDKIFIFKTEVTNNLSFAESEVELRENSHEFTLYSSGSKRKLQGKIWHTNWGVYTSLGVETMNYKKFCGIFFRAETNTLNLSWNVNIMGNPPMTNLQPCHDQNLCSGNCTDLGMSMTGSKSENNTSRVCSRFGWAVGIGISLIGGDIDGISGVEDIPIKFRRHLANGIPCLSDHNAITGCCGTITTPTVKWKKCI